MEALALIMNTLREVGIDTLRKSLAPRMEAPESPPSEDAMPLHRAFSPSLRRAFSLSFRQELVGPLC